MFIRWWNKLTKAPDHVTDVVLQRQIRLLSGLLLTMCFLGLVSNFLQLILLTGYIKTFIAVSTGILLLFAAYGLARTGQFHWAARLSVLTLSLVCFALIVLNPLQGVAYAFLSTCLLLASLLFKESGFILTAVLVMLGVVIGVPAMGVPPPDHDSLATPIFLTIFTAMLFIYRRHMLTIEKAHQEEILGHENEFRAFFEQTSVGVAKIETKSGRFLRLNQRFCDISGYSMEELIKKSCLEITHPDDTGIDREMMRKLINGDLKNYSLEIRFYRKDGNLIWVTLTVSPLWKAGEEPDTYIAVVQEITERKLAEQNLSKIARGVSATTGEHFFQSMVDHLAETLGADITFVGEFTSVSFKHIQTLAVNVSGGTSDNFDYALANTPCAQLFETGPCAVISDIQRKFPKDSLLVEMGAESYAGVPLFDSKGDALGVIAVLFRRPIIHEEKILATLDIFATRATAEIERLKFDIESRNSEIRLSELASRQQAILDGADYSIISTDTKGTILSFNKAAQRMLGYLPEEMIGKQTPEIIHDRDEVIKRAKELSIELGEKIDPGFDVFVELPKRGQAEEREWTYISKNGRRFPVRLSVTPVLSSSGNITGYMGIAADLSAQKAAQEELHKSEANYKLLFDNMTSGFALHEIICDANGKPIDYLYLQANPAFEKLTGVPVSTIVGKRLREILPNTEDYWIEVFGKVALTGEPISYENYSREIGKYFDTWVFSPRKKQFAVIFTDISLRKAAESQMHKLSGAIEQTADSVIITDIRGVIEYANPAFLQTTGYSLKEVIGNTPRLVNSGVHDASFFQHLWQTIESGGVYRGVLTNRRKNGSEYYEEKTITPLKDSTGQITHYISTGKDVTARMKTQQQMAYMAQHDALTELPNRTLLLDRINQAIARARWHERIVSVVFIDLDSFKTINDTLGHEVGDKLLQQLAERFATCVREGDTVARFGGDEFVILLDDVADEGDIRNLVKKVLDAITPVFTIESRQLFISASIGISLYPSDGEDATTLLKHADVAMYRAKELGKNTYQFYSAELSARAFQRLTLESNLRNALARNEFRLFYQPVFDIRTNCISSIEALLRWQHPDLGLVLPNDFISTLEDTGLIVPVGEWVLKTACSQLGLWHKQGWPELSLAVNLSPRQFQNNDLLNSLQQALSLLKCSPDHIELEITENILMQPGNVSQLKLEALHKLGVRLAIDDFGTGYSSLSYLRRFPVDTLKIDRSFVQDIPDDPDDGAITTAIAVLAQTMKMQVVAEGVEKKSQSEFLEKLGCYLMQGNYYSKPLTATEVESFLKKHNPC